MSALVETLSRYGANPEGLRVFDDDAPELLPYATLTAARGAGTSLRALLGVYEWQDEPLLYLLDGSTLHPQELRRIRRALALRGDAPYLAVVEPGRLVVHTIALDDEEPAASRVQLGPTRSNVVPTLANARPRAEHDEKNWVTGVILQLLEEAISTLEREGLAENDALSLTGRALFVRFLGDRGMLLKSGIHGTDAFDNAKQAQASSNWLDNTFNGDFLPLQPEAFDRLTPRAFRVLGNIARRAPGGQLILGWDTDWRFLDFAHIPVGVLSQAYERHLRSTAPQQQRKEGVFYTPESLAELVVRTALHDLDADQPRILDPAAGAGMFLLVTFRRLVAARWRMDKRRPDTATLREILYNQVVGFDVNEAALRFAALALYLLLIELDPSPEPVEKLRFQNLRNRVLFCFGSLPAGSLDDRVGDEHRGSYDAVLGNPPWTSGTGLPGYETVKARVNVIAASRLGDDAIAPLPNEVMDLPFLWRATEWTIPDGRIAFALSARLLFQQGDGMAAARSAIFRALDVTGVVNGTALRRARVWPGISSPFCLLFARNRPSGPTSGFRFASPWPEVGVNNTSGLRIDAHSAPVVTVQELLDEPRLLKTLFRGGPLDREIMSHLNEQRLVSLDGYWAERFGRRRGKLRQTGNGVQRVRPSSRVRRGGDGLAGAPADYLHDFEFLESGDPGAVLLNQRLQRFSWPRLHDPRDESIFRGPLVLVLKSPPVTAGRIPVSVSERDIVYNESWYGYSAAGHAEAQRLVRYLALCIGSRIALWYILLTSGEFGYEREVVEKFMVESVPLVPFESLTKQEGAEVDRLFSGLARGKVKWNEVDAWVANLWGLSRKDQDVIEDTLRYRLPFASNVSDGLQPPTATAVRTFCGILRRELQPWARRVGGKLFVSDAPPDGPWRLLWISTVRDVPEAPRSWRPVVQLADSLGATEVVCPVRGGIWVARLPLARCWTRSQARLVARKIIWDHLPDLLGRGRTLGKGQA